MIDEQREYGLDCQDDAALAALMDEYAEAEGEALWAAFEEAERNGQVPEVPAELDETCRKMIRASEKKRVKDFFPKRMEIFLRRAAVFVLVFFALGSTVVMSVDAFRMPVLNLFIVDKGRYSTVNFGQEVEQVEKTLLDKILDVAPPEGYELIVSEILADGTINVRYQNSDQKILRILFNPSIRNLSVDTEDVDQRSMKLYDYEAIYMQKRYYRIVWVDATYEGLFDVAFNGSSEIDFWKYVYRLAE